ncbi:MAG: glutamyl-tRNA reductase [Magnetococcus sp. DMHC-6]
MKIAVVGLNHKTAPVAVRECLAFAKNAIPDRLINLKGLAEISEGVILSTCNRVEIYLAAKDPELAVARVINWLAKGIHIPQAELIPHLYSHLEKEAIQHGFRVASSLDSMVVGEAQILGQVKDAYQIAVSAGTTGLILNKFFHRAFQVAKRIRTETAIAENAVSVSFAAVSLAKRIFGDLKGHACLLIGAGEMCELAARHMAGHGVDILVTNRTYERAVDLAHQFSGHAFPLEQLADHLDRADIVISSTGSTKYLVDAIMVKTALKRRRQKPMFFIDIAVPRDLDPKIGNIDSAFLYDIDDLIHIVENNQQGRSQAILDAEAILEEEIPAFLGWLESLNVVPTIVAMRQRLEKIRDQERDKLLANWPNLDDTDKQRMDVFLRLLINKLLHTPTSRLREMAAQPDGDRYVDAIRKLFDLDVSEK